MKKYKINAPVDYVMGHLRYGSYQGIIELDESRLNDNDYVYEMIRSRCNFEVEDYRIEDIGPIIDIDLEEVKEDIRDKWAIISELLDAFADGKKLVEAAPDNIKIAWRIVEGYLNGLL